MEKIELKEKDVKLLAYMYHNNREPLTKIAKAIGLTRQQVEYALGKYKKEGIIRKFAGIFNYSKFGYKELAVLFVKFSRQSNYRIFCSWLRKSKNALSFGKMLGKYDLYANMIFIDEKQLNEFILKMLKENKEEIDDYLVIRPYFVELFPLKFLDIKIGESYKLIEKVEEVKLKEKEKELLMMLEKDSRIKLIELADKIGLSCELALHKLKKLRKEKIILGSRIVFNMKKLGYYFSQIWVNVKNLVIEEKLKNFAKNSNLVNSLILSIGKPNCIIQLFHKSQEELLETIEKIKNLFEDETIEFEISYTKDDEEINTLPFL